MQSWQLRGMNVKIEENSTLQGMKKGVGRIANAVKITGVKCINHT